MIAKLNLSTHYSAFRQRGDRWSYAPPTLLQIMPFKGSSSSIAVAIFWHRSLVPHFLVPSEALYYRSFEDVLFHHSIRSFLAIEYDGSGAIHARLTLKLSSLPDEFSHLLTRPNLCLLCASSISCLLISPTFRK